MKNISFIIIFLLILSTVFSQKDKPVVCVSATTMNILYMGVDNPLTIAVAGYNDEDIKVSISPHGSITKVGKGRYIARVSNRKDVSISVFVKGKPAGSSKKFRVKKFPDPEVCINGKTGGKISKQELINSILLVKFPDSDYDMKLRVRSFSVSANIGAYDKIFWSNSGTFSKEQKNMIKSLKKGDKIIIDDIIVTGATARRIMSPMIFTIE